MISRLAVPRPSGSLWPWALALLLAAAMSIALAQPAVPRPLTPLVEAPPAEPLPVPAPRVGIQVGHWNSWQAPDELSALRNSMGAYHDDWGEMLVNHAVATRVAAILEGEGVQVELLPATVPPNYRADAFVSLHGDANSNPRLSGFKASHSTWSEIPEVEDQLVGYLAKEYGAATGLKEHRPTITDNMTQYYAFNQRFEHSVHPSTPAAIFEMGFLTTEGDRKMLLQEQDRVAEGIANGILRFLASREK